MHTAPLGDRRNIIPRWRTFRRTLAAGELARAAKPSKPATAPLPQEAVDRFKLKKNAWQEERSPKAAAELIGAALVLGREEDAFDAAEFALQEGGAEFPGLRRVAASVLGDSDYDSSTSPPKPEKTDYQGEIHRLRVGLRDDPRNVVKRVDLARGYAVLGQGKQATQAMEVALKLAPQNRFVLRSAARLFVHEAQPDRAHDLLRKAHAVGFDPWLLSAEIATANVADRNSALIDKGPRLLDSDSWTDFETNELASAVATEGLHRGDFRVARRLFRRALVAPNENSVAQAEWASRQLRSLSIDPESYEAPWSFEAKTRSHYFAGEFEQALAACRDWLFDEPFSSRPAQAGSFISGVVLERFEESVEWARRGLDANPNDQTLRNNLVFGLASLERIREAEEELKKVNRSVAPQTTRVALLATEGLLAYRSNDPSRGRKLYQKAIERTEDFQGVTEDELRILATLFFLREEIRVGGSETKRLVGELKDRAISLDRPELLPYLVPLSESITGRPAVSVSDESR